MRAYFDLGKSTEGGRLDDLAKRIEDMRSLLGSRILSLEYHEDWAKSQIKNLTLLVADAREAIGELSARLTAIETKIGQLDNSQLAEVDYEERLNEWRGQVAERVTNLEKGLCVLSIATRRSDDDLADRISTLEQQVARPIVAEIRDSTGARTIYRAIEERAKDEIRTLIRETVYGEPLSTSVSQNLLQRVRALEERIDPCPLIAEHDRRLSLQLERITELANNVHSLQQTVKVIRERLYENVTDDADYGLLEQVRRLDADMALVRDAVCPPQEAATIEAAQISVDYSRYAEQIRAVQSDWYGQVTGREFRTSVGVVESDDVATGVEFGASMCERRGTHPPVDWPDPTPTMLESPVFEAIWQTIKTWDIAVPGAYSGYCEATGNHVRAILDGVKSRFGDKSDKVIVYSRTHRDLLVERLGKYAEHLRQTRDALRAACLELGADATWSDDTNLADVASKVLMPAVRGWLAGTELPNLDFDGPIIPKQTTDSPVFKAVWSVIDGWFDETGEPVTGSNVLSVLRSIQAVGLVFSGTRHDDLAYALGRAYVALKDLEPYEPKVADEEMEAIRQVLGNNYRDWLRPRGAG